ncbi:MAG TPA: hypothetical protein VF230_19280, partial [Acidimicrobiales bacterium]
MTATASLAQFQRDAIRALYHTGPITPHTPGEPGTSPADEEGAHARAAKTLRDKRMKRLGPVFRSTFGSLHRLGLYQGFVQELMSYPVTARHLRHEYIEREGDCVLLAVDRMAPRFPSPTDHASVRELARFEIAKGRMHIPVGSTGAKVDLDAELVWSPSGQLFRSDLDV